MFPVLLLLFTAYPIENVRVVDADTFVGTIVLPWDIALHQVKIRPADYDAWEATRVRFGSETTDEELRRGKEAKHSIELALQSGKLFIDPVVRQRDDYGRLLGILYLERHGKRTKLADWMKARGHVRGSPNPDPDTTGTDP